MAAFNGKWKLISTKNVPEFSRSIGMSEELVTTITAIDDVANDLVDEFTITDTDCTLTMYKKGEQRSSHVNPLNIEVEEPFIDERKAKITVCVNGGQYTRTQKGDDFTATYTRTIDGDIMTLVMTSDKGVTGTRKLKRM